MGTPAPLRGMLLVLGLLPAAALADEGFGQRILGTLGLDAGTQSASGFYYGDRFILFTADRLLGRDGQPLPVRGLDTSAFANIFGMAGTWQFGDGPYYTAAFAVPVAGMRLRSDLPPNTLDRQGLGYIFLSPIKLGWRFPRLDLVSSYSLYAPTGQLNRRGVAQPQWTHQVSAGGTVFFDDERASRLSALTSYNLYERKPGLDVTRGDTVQIQGGIGSRLFRLLDVGVAGYGFWQVAADTGSDLPASLRGIREYAVGVGPEVGILIPALQGKLTARYEWEVAGRSRLDGQVLVVSLSLLGWKPDGQE